LLIYQNHCLLYYYYYYYKRKRLTWHLVIELQGHVTVTKNTSRENLYEAITTTTVGVQITVLLDMAPTVPQATDNNFFTFIFHAATENQVY